MSAAHWVALACVVGLGLLVLGMALGAMLRRHREQASSRAHNLRARRGEQRAERVLQELGYQIVERQARGTYQVWVDGEARAVPLVADYVVARDGRELIAEVKTGKHAPRFEYADTRRQLLEYQLAFHVDAVLLVDIEAKRVREVRFPLAQANTLANTLETRGSGAWLGWLTAAALISVLVWWTSKP